MIDWCAVVPARLLKSSCNRFDCANIVQSYQRPRNASGAVPKNRLGHRIGHLDTKDIERVNQASLIFLGLGG
jgi:hypothetical protein